VKLRFGTEVNSLAELGEADLVVGANGAFSWIRTQNEDKLGTTTDRRPNRFIWYGTTKAFDSLTLTFRETGVGVFCAHHYRYRPDLSTFLVEVEEGTWKRAGFEAMAPQVTIRYCERVFAKDLDGHAILSNNSYWRNFPAVWNERWSFDNVVLLGDALRTAHFSIGSGTRLAFEDVIALARALRAQGGDVPSALQAYETARRPVVDKLVAAANQSADWYEHFVEHMQMAPWDMAWSYIQRSGRVDIDKLRQVSPRFVAGYQAWAGR
jgi:2-polyprenyl-6-methoxyphenol hydroxylase-like FAD-dependent oxidoreductase